MTDELYPGNMIKRARATGRAAVTGASGDHEQVYMTAPRRVFLHSASRRTKAGSAMLGFRFIGRRLTVDYDDTEAKRFWRAKRALSELHNADSLQTQCRETVTHLGLPSKVVCVDG